MADPPFLKLKHHLLHPQGNPKFLEAVASWQKKLGTVDLVLNVWNDVQRKWQALESIFVGSADIRVQLPEDSKRFDAVNADYVVGFCCLAWQPWEHKGSVAFPACGCLRDPA